MKGKNDIPTPLDIIIPTEKAFLTTTTTTI